MKYLSIDRIDNELAVCEDELGEKHEINVLKLPPGIKEGNILTLDHNKKWIINHKLTISRKNYINILRNKIYNKNLTDV